MLKVIQCNTHSLYLLLVLSSLVFISGSVLSSSTVSADDSVVDKVNITVPTSCSMTGTGMNTHNAEIINGNYVQNIGTTTLHAFCNDSEGFAIYAAGYTGNDIGQTNSNKLVGTSASNNATIETGIATSAGNPDVSNWAMKLTATQDSGDTTGTNALTIDSAPNTSGGANASFSQYHVVPNEYTKVAHKNSNTDMTATTGGVKLTTTYAAYISRTQVADTYSGKVIYTLVHPSNHDAPVAHPAVLDTGKTVNSKLKSLAATVVNGEDTTITPEFDPLGDYDFYEADDQYIKSISVHLKTPTPTGFTPTEKNTISTPDSKKPIYAVFDNSNDAGIMHFYTEGEQVFLSPDSSFMFYELKGLSEISGISNWDTSNVTDMSNMFFYASVHATSFNLDLSDWDTSSVTNMSLMFFYTSNSDTYTTWSIGDLSSWDTSSVTDMSGMFEYAGNSATTWSVGDLSSWDTSSVTDMHAMFDEAGYSATTWSIGDISSWNTSNVTNMGSMFGGVGSYVADFNLDLSSWDVSNVAYMGSMFSQAGYLSTSFNLDLSSWNTSNVTDMSGMFNEAGYSATTFTLDLSSWNTSNVTDMSGMFNEAGYSATTFTLDLSSWNTASVAANMSRMFYEAGYSATTFNLNLSSWDTSSVTNMRYMFGNAGYLATTWSITGLSSWNTASVRDMSYMFSNAGYSATTFTLDLSSWNTASVSNMSYMFSHAGYSATTWSVGNLSSWNTASVTNMSYMFRAAGYSATTFTLDLSSWNTASVANTFFMSYVFNEAGYSATTWSVTIPRTNDGTTTGPITNTTSRLYGKTTSTYAEPGFARSFTLAQP